MSSQLPPDPITTGFNPEAWVADAGLSTRALQASYMTYPIVQNFPTTFQSALSCLTPSASDNSIFVATTEWFNLFFTARKVLGSIIWSGLQNFATILTPTIVGNTRIGNAVDNNIEVATTASRTAVLSLGTGAGSSGIIEIGNGNGATNNVQILYSATNNSTGEVNLGNSTSTLNIRTPLTPLYTNLPVFYVATANNVTYGTKVGAVGQIIYSANNTTQFPGLVTNLSVTLSVGTWLLTGECKVDNTFSDRFYFGFNTVANDTNMFCGFGPTFGYNSGTLPGGLRLNTIYTVTSGTPTIFLINRGYNFGMAISKRVITATRLA